MKKLLSIIARSALAVWTFTGCNANVNTRSPVEGKKSVLYYIILYSKYDRKRHFYKLLKVLRCGRVKLGMTGDTFFTDDDSVSSGKRLRIALKTDMTKDYRVINDWLVDCIGY